MSVEMPYIPDDVLAELNDEKFATRQHYSRATYALGCHGPLCRLKEKHRGRSRNALRAQDEGREYEPIAAARKDERESVLMPIVRWHLESRAKQRVEQVLTLSGVIAS